MDDNIKFTLARVLLIVSKLSYGIGYMLNHGMHIWCYIFLLVSITFDLQQEFNPPLPLIRCITGHKDFICIIMSIFKYMSSAAFGGSVSLDIRLYKASKSF